SGDVNSLVNAREFGSVEILSAPRKWIRATTSDCAGAVTAKNNPAKNNAIFFIQKLLFAKCRVGVQALAFAGQAEPGLQPGAVEYRINFIAATPSIRFHSTCFNFVLF